MRLAFTTEYANLLLLLNGLVILLFLYSRKKQKERVMQFGNYETLKKVAGGNFIRSDDIIMITRILALTALLIGLSSPVIIEDVMGADTDFAIVLDSSASMFTGDIEPNRFEAAKEVSQDFVSQLGNSSSVGVISYSGSVTEEQGMTDNLELVNTRIGKAEIGEDGGTATGDAVAAGVSMLIGRDQPGNVLLITDGRSTVGQSINDSAEYAQRQNITVNTIGIGETNNSLEDSSGIVDGETGRRMEFPNLNSEGLNYLANSTGGESVFVSSREGLETAFVNLEEKEAETDISQWFLLVAGRLMVLEAVFRTTDFQVIP